MTNNKSYNATDCYVKRSYKVSNDVNENDGLTYEEPSDDELVLPSVEVGAERRTAANRNDWILINGATPNLGVDGANAQEPPPPIVDSSPFVVNVRGGSSNRLRAGRRRTKRPFLAQPRLVTPAMPQAPQPFDAVALQQQQQQQQQQQFLHNHDEWLTGPPPLPPATMVQPPAPPLPQPAIPARPRQRVRRPRPHRNRRPGTRQRTGRPRTTAPPSFAVAAVPPPPPPPPPQQQRPTFFAPPPPPPPPAASVFPTAVPRTKPVKTTQAPIAIPIPQAQPSIPRPAAVSHLSPAHPSAARGGDPNARFLQCCHDRNVAAVCHSRCNFDLINRKVLTGMFVGTDPCPQSWGRTLLGCAAGDQDHSTCCRAAGAHLTSAKDKCLGFCNMLPGVTFQADLSMLPCWSVLDKIKTCFKSGLSTA